jgi:hypothetical protein
MIQADQSLFLKRGNRFELVPAGAMDMMQELPGGNYVVKCSPTGEYYLEKADDFKSIKKVYGKGNRYAERIISTFENREASTGVLLNGEKGSGKTLLARELSIQMAKKGVPTLLVNQEHAGETFRKFMQDIHQPCIVLFDEFEKVFSHGAQEDALTLFDGVCQAKKLFIMTVNNKWAVNEHMRNRPGRIFYLIDFKGLDEAFIREYCEEVLVNQSHIDSICSLAVLFEEFNFDMLKALVEEMNRYNETPRQALELLNMRPEAQGNESYDITHFAMEGGKVMDPAKLHRSVWHGDPTKEEVAITWYAKDESGEECGFEEEFTVGDLKNINLKVGLFEYEHKNGAKLSFLRRPRPDLNMMSLIA